MNPKIQALILALKLLPKNSLNKLKKLLKKSASWVSSKAKKIWKRLTKS
jgi:hypothetical protein